MGQSFTCDLVRPTCHSRLERVVFLVNLILMIPVVTITFNDLYYTRLITGPVDIYGARDEFARDWYQIVV